MEKINVAWRQDGEGNIELLFQTPDVELPLTVSPEGLHRLVGGLLRALRAADEHNSFPIQAELSSLAIGRERDGWIDLQFVLSEIPPFEFSLPDEYAVQLHEGLLAALKHADDKTEH